MVMVRVRVKRGLSCTKNNFEKNGHLFILGFRQRSCVYTHSSRVVFTATRFDHPTASIWVSCRGIQYVEQKKWHA